MRLSQNLRTLLLRDPSGVRVVSIDGEDMLRAQADAVAVHPSGGRFAYSASEGSATGLFVAASDTESALVGRVLGSVEGLTWGPDADDLTFVERLDDETLTIAILDTRSGVVSTFELLSEPHQAAEPSWSRHGRWLAIEAQTTETLSPMTVYLLEGVDGPTMIVDPLEGLTSHATAPRFSPTSDRLAYVYTGAGALVAELRFVDVGLWERQTVAQRALNAFRWSRDGGSLLVALHETVCMSGLVRVSSETLEVTRLYQGSGNTSPMYLDDEVALFVTRPCDGSDHVPTGTGTLVALELATGETTTLARDVFAGVPLDFASATQRDPGMHSDGVR